MGWLGVGWARRPNPLHALNDAESDDANHDGGQQGVKKHIENEREEVDVKRIRGGADAFCRRVVG